jgi:PIN domain nuclease of toxin-antitoxin system
VRLLLDTHILLWGLADATKISAQEEAALRAPDNQVFVSVVSLWEIAIKAEQGRLDPPADLPQLIESNPDFELLPILAEHAWRVRTLPRLHGDPFDRLLISQAYCEDMTLMSRDPWMARYGVPVFVA